MAYPASLGFVTASLKVDYLKPTPLGVPLEVRARVKEIKGRKVVMEAWLSARGRYARGEVVAIQAPPRLFGEENSGINLCHNSTLKRVPRQQTGVKEAEDRQLPGKFDQAVAQDYLGKQPEGSHPDRCSKTIGG